MLSRIEGLKKIKKLVLRFVQMKIEISQYDEMTVYSRIEANSYENSSMVNLFLTEGGGLYMATR